MRPPRPSTAVSVLALCAAIVGAVWVAVILAISTIVLWHRGR